MRHAPAAAAPSAAAPSAAAPSAAAPSTAGRAESATDEDVHLAALLAVLTLVRADETSSSTPLQQWRARRLAALSRDGRRR